MKASIRTFSARQQSSSSSAWGWSVAMASSTLRTVRLSSSGIGWSPIQVGHSSRARRSICGPDFVIGRCGPRLELVRRQVRLERVAELLRVQLGPEPEVAGGARQQLVPQPGREASMAARAAAAAASTSARSASSSRSDASWTAVSTRSIRPGIRSAAFSAWNALIVRRTAGVQRGSAAWSSAAGNPGSRAATLRSRSGSGANSRASRLNRPLPNT